VFAGVAEAFLIDLEVLDIGDESVLVRVYGFEEEFPDIGRDSHLEELEGEVEEVDELGEVRLYSEPWAM
jgi:hypothetical protein